MRPSGGTTCAPISRSDVTPYVRPRIRRPPPRVNPAMPTGGQVPPGMVRPSPCSAAYTLPRRAHRWSPRRRDGDRAHGRHVEHDTPGRRPAAEAVPSAARHRAETVAAGERDGRRSVLRSRAPRDGLRPAVVEPGVERPWLLVVGRRAGQDDPAGDLPSSASQSEVNSAAMERHATADPSRPFRSAPQTRSPARFGCWPTSTVRLVPTRDRSRQPLATAGLRRGCATRRGGGWGGLRRRSGRR
jgi:hypothetical protein